MATWVGRLALVATLVTFLSVSPQIRRTEAQDGAAGATVVGLGGSPSWSPSGAKLTWWSDGGLVVRDMASGAQSSVPELNAGRGYPPVWLPDESGLAVIPFATDRLVRSGDSGVRTLADLNLFLADVATGKARALTDFADQTAVGRATVSADGCYAVLEGPKLGGPYLSETLQGRRERDGTITETPISVPYAGLWMVDLTTGEREVLMRDEKSMEFFPQFLPDGKRILFERRTRFLDPRLSGNRPDTNVVLYDTTTKQMRHLTQMGLAFDPRLAPDGHTVAFVRAIAPQDIWLMDTESGVMWQIDTGRRVMCDSWTLAWTPDSRYVLFCADGDVYAVGRSGRGPFRLTSDLGIPQVYARGFSVHPDGQRVAFWTGAAEVVVARLDWSGVPGYLQAE